MLPMTRFRSEPRGIRTPDRSVKSRLLYQTELWAQGEACEDSNLEIHRNRTGPAVAAPPGPHLRWSAVGSLSPRRLRCPADATAIQLLESRERIELSTCGLRIRCSNHLSYRPKALLPRPICISLG